MEGARFVARKIESTVFENQVKVYPYRLACQFTHRLCSIINYTTYLVSEVWRETRIGKEKFHPYICHRCFDRTSHFSIFYVFYEQYLTLAYDAATQLVLSLAVIFLVSGTLNGLDPWGAIVSGESVSFMAKDLIHSHKGVLIYQ